MTLCKCGCGEAVASPKSTFRAGHNRRGMERRTTCSRDGCDEPSVGYRAVCRKHHWMNIRRWKYGITDAEYEALMAAQGGVCAICGGVEANKSLSVDHDHQTGEIRGLLCGNCNHILGKARDDPRVLRAAIDYLERRI